MSFTLETICFNFLFSFRGPQISGDCDELVSHVHMCAHVHCPRAGPGRVGAIFAGPDPGPQGWATVNTVNTFGADFS